MGVVDVMRRSSGDTAPSGKAGSILVVRRARLIAAAARHAGEVPEPPIVRPSPSSSGPAASSVRPADVGLPDSGRRRTPGLRREELAALAGVSIDYLVRLEQGRDTNPSARGARRAGRRPAAVRRRARSTSSAWPPSCRQPELCPQRSTAPRRGAADRAGAARPARPDAGVRDRPWFDVLAWNASWAGWSPRSACSTADRPNLARFTFLAPPGPRGLPRLGGDGRRAGQRPPLDGARPRRRTRLRRAGRRAAAGARRSPSAGRATSWSRSGGGPSACSHPDVGELRVAYEVLLPARRARPAVDHLAPGRRGERRRHPPRRRRGRQAARAV